MVMPQTDLEAASMLGERLRAKVQRQMSITVSGGVASAIDGDSPESLLERADTAMYRAKCIGRNRVFYHNGETTEAVSEDVDQAGTAREGSTLCVARFSHTTHTANQATEEHESDDLEAVVAGATGP